ncbi:HEAT repeat domain-containing protein [Leptolyngbya sp. PCC 6406]|uniref:HEAT repeat domain-containing protein n=1 Tax=Leptolyngbya sp. PCC 6406 TaxID=1173264 RepID=UPI0004800B10|nr:HEAT repeat domain-containing protein [Leptolyngbya sp. PCC 6406]
MSAKIVISQHAAHILYSMGSGKFKPFSTIMRQFEAVTPLLLAALADSNLAVQSSAIQALGQLGNEVAVPQLLQVLEGPQHWTVNG